MSDVVGRRPASLDAETVAEATAAVVDPYVDRLAAADRVVVVPDVHYPHNPSTGQVTNPDVVDGLVRTLERDGLDVAIGCAAARRVESDRAARYLGYERLAERRDVPLVDLDDAERVERTARVRDKSYPVTMPRPLDEGAVVAVPTLRRAAHMELAAGMTTLARAVHEHRPVAYDAVSAAAACGDAVSLLDATYACADAPRESRFLLASDDVPTLDRVAAELLGLDHDDVPYLSLADVGRPDAVRGVSLDALAAAAPSGDPPEASDPGDLAGAGYRLYAKLAGDAVPPQFVEDADPLVGDVDQLAGDADG